MKRGTNDFWMKSVMSKLKIGDKVRIKNGSMIHDHSWVYDFKLPNYRGGKPNEMIPVYFKKSRRASTVTITHIDNLEDEIAF